MSMQNLMALVLFPHLKSLHDCNGVIIYDAEFKSAKIRRCPVAWFSYRVSLNSFT